MITAKSLKWQQILEDLSGKIRRGELRGKLPSYQKLSAQYGVAVITIGRVVRELERRGYVVVRPKSGVTVEPQNRPEEKTPLRRANHEVKTIALVLPTSVADPYWARLASGALCACEKRNQMGRTKWRLQLNYGLPNIACGLGQTLVVPSGNLTPGERMRAEEVEKQNILDISETVEGLIIAPRVLFDADFYLSLMHRGTRLLTLDNKLSGVPVVTSHNRRAAYKGIAFLLLGVESQVGRVLRRAGTAQSEAMTEHLAMCSPQVYVLTESTAQATTLRERIAGCHDALRDAATRGYKVAPTWLRSLPPLKDLDTNTKSAHQETLALLDNLERAKQLGQGKSGKQTTPVAIFALTDRCALGAYQALKTKGYADWTNPHAEAVALLSYDNIWQNLEAYSISSLVQDAFQMGQSGAEMLFDLPHPHTFLTSGELPPDVLLDVGLVQRDSTLSLPQCVDTKAKGE